MAWTPLSPIEDFFLFFFIAYLAFVSHDQDFKPNLYFPIGNCIKMPDPPHKLNFFMFLFCVSELPDHFLFKKEIEEKQVVRPPPP